MILVVLLYALWGFTFTLGKYSVIFATPLFTVGTRMLASGTILLGYTLATKRITDYVPQRRDIWLYVQLTIFLVLLPYILRLWALQFVSSIKAALLFNVGPFFTALFCYIFHKEKLHHWQYLGLLIGFLGTIPILLTGSATEDMWGMIGFMSIPEVAVIGATAALSYGLIIMQKLVKHRGCPPYLANGISMLSGGFIALSGSLLFDAAPIKQSTQSFIIVIVLQIVISNLFCSNLQAKLLTTYSPTFMSFAGFMSPLFTCMYGYLLFNETVTWHFFASLVLVAVGLWLFQCGNRSCQTECAE